LLQAVLAPCLDEHIFFKTLFRSSKMSFVTDIGLPLPVAEQAPLPLPSPVQLSVPASSPSATATATASHWKRYVLPLVTGGLAVYLARARGWKYTFGVTLVVMVLSFLLARYVLGW
jgi:hypothetical protein